MTVSAVTISEYSQFRQVAGVHGGDTGIRAKSPETVVAYLKAWLEVARISNRSRYKVADTIYSFFESKGSKLSKDTFAKALARVEVQPDEQTSRDARAGTTTSVNPTASWAGAFTTSRLVDQRRPRRDGPPSRTRIFDAPGNVHRNRRAATANLSINKDVRDPLIGQGATPQPGRDPEQPHRL